MAEVGPKLASGIAMASRAAGGRDEKELEAMKAAKIPSSFDIATKKYHELWKAKWAAEKAGLEWTEKQEQELEAAARNMGAGPFGRKA